MAAGIKRIVGVGSRIHACDAAGPSLFDPPQRVARSADVETVDAGPGGVDLIRPVEGARRVVIVDAVTDVDPTGGVVVLRASDVAARARRDRPETLGRGATERVPV